MCWQEPNKLNLNDLDETQSSEWSRTCTFPLKARPAQFLPGSHLPTRVDNFSENEEFPKTTRENGVTFPGYVQFPLLDRIPLVLVFVFLMKWRCSWHTCLSSSMLVCEWLSKQPRADNQDDDTWLALTLGLFLSVLHLGVCRWLRSWDTASLQSPHFWDFWEWPSHPDCPGLSRIVQAYNSVFSFYLVKILGWLHFLPSFFPQHNIFYWFHIIYL